MANTYTDIDFNFLADETGDITILTDEACVKQSIKNIILTSIGELAKYQKEFFGSKINYYLGEKIDRIISLGIEDEIRNAIDNHEERVDIINIITSMNNNAYKIIIKYKIKNINLNDSLSITLGVLT